MFEKAEQERVAVGLIQLVEGVVQRRAESCPVGCFRFDFIHRDSLLFAPLAALIGAHKLRRRETSGAMQPAGKHDVLREHRGLSCEVRKNELRYVLCEVDITANPPQRRGIDEVKVPLDQLAESGLRAISGVTAQQL